MAQTQRSGLPRLWFSVAVPLGINGGAARHSKTGRLYPKAGWNHPKQQPLSPQACPTSYLHSLPETHRSYPKLGRHLFFLFIAVRRTARAGRLPTGGPQHAACASRVAVPPGRPPHRNNAPLPLLFVRFVLGALLALSSSGRSLRGPRQRELRASAAGGFGPRDSTSRRSTTHSSLVGSSPPQFCRVRAARSGGGPKAQRAGPAPVGSQQFRPNHRPFITTFCRVRFRPQPAENEILRPRRPVKDAVRPLRIRGLRADR